MPATRLQAKAHIATKITDPKNYQNTAALVREVLEYVMLHCFVLAEDQLTIAQVTDLAATLSNKADLVGGKVPASQLPAFSTFWGTMAKAADNAQTVEQAISAAVAAVVNASPAQLDTLNELAAALGNDANFAATVNAAIAAKIPATEKGAANGVATLDATGKVPASQLPASTGTGTSSGIDLTLNFKQLETYNLVYGQSFKITEVSTSSAGVTATLTVGGAGYVLGATVNAWQSLDIAVNNLGSVRLKGTLI